MSQKGNVKLYTLSTCSHCKATKKFLDQNGIKYSFTDVDLLQGKEKEEIIAEVMKVNPSCSFPTILIGDSVIVGFKEAEIREALAI
jgi:glutaredoxin-like protein NrdH